MSPTLRSRLVFAGLMSLLMSSLMSAWVTWLNLGFSPVYLERWLHAFAAAWPAAFVIVAALAPKVQRLSHYLLTIGSAQQSGA